MNFLLRSLFTISFFLIVCGEWEKWNTVHRDCLKIRFEAYVAAMEGIFAPNNSLGDQSFVKELAKVHPGKIKSLKNFLELFGKYVVKCARHLNHDYVTADAARKEEAKGVVLTLCAKVKENCPGVSDPMPLGTELHETYVNVLKGQESTFLENCGEYDRDAAPLLYDESYKPGKMPSTSSSRSNRFSFKGISRMFSRNSDETQDSNA